MIQLPISSVQKFGQKMKENISRVIVGKEMEIKILLAALLSGGHVLLEDVPGVGKTILARSLAISFGGTFSRIQCTPDLLPSDITGVSVYDQKLNDFVFRPGPVLAQIVLADEINRATPRTQSSLLEAMGEGQVTVDGVTYQLEQPFLVLATQNPIEYEGTFPLPEAQLDRFLVRLDLGYPSLEEEDRLLHRLQKKHPIHELTACTDPTQVAELQNAVTEVFVEDSVRDYIVRLVQSTRTHSQVRLGVSPRGSLFLLRASQAWAALSGRDFILPDDVKKMAVPVLAHRLRLKTRTELRGISAAGIIEELLAAVAVKAEPKIETDL
ncbi:MAG: MoxR family ATPase [Firmicutes bacterium]|nr:MoxR family ATPase [Bacillota bacterium]